MGGHVESPPDSKPAAPASKDSTRKMTNLDRNARLYSGSMFNNLKSHKAEFGYAAWMELVLHKVPYSSTSKVHLFSTYGTQYNLRFQSYQDS